MNKLKTINYAGSLIAFAIVALSTTAYSASIPDRGPIPFAVYDKDGNGLISEKEFSEVRAERISKRAAEGRPMRGAANTPTFSAFDTNGDGHLTKDELTAGQKIQMEKRRGMGMGQGRGMGMGRNMPVFSEYDLDGDGVIVEEEFNEARGNRISARAQQGYPMRNLGKSPLFTDIDVNKDGKISPQEFALHQSQRRKMNQNQLDSSSNSTQQEAVFDPRKLVAMPEKARDIMRKDMQASLAALNAIIGYLAANDFDAAAESAEKVMGQSTMGRHRTSGAAPGWFMPNEMRSLGWGMHAAASEFALVAKQGDLNNSLKNLEKLTSACVACHYTYRTR